MILKPYNVLGFLSNSTKYPNSLSAALMQLLGGCVFALMTPLLLAIPKTRAGIESRPIVYVTMLAGEVVLIPVMMWQALVAKSIPETALIFCGNLVGLIIWRVWVLWFRPSWMGRYSEQQKDASGYGLRRAIREGGNQIVKLFWPTSFKPDCVVDDWLSSRPQNTP